MKILVWHWGRRGAGPLVAARLAAAINQLPGHRAMLSLAAGAEILSEPDAPICDWAEPTYSNAAGYLLARVAGLLLAGSVTRRLTRLRPDFAICAMPALLDSRMTAGLRTRKIPYAVIVHDGTAHLGEGFNFHVLGQARLLREAKTLFALSGHVAADLRRQGFGANRAIIKLWHPPFDFGIKAAPPLAHGGLPRLLFFGRLLPYKGLDLLADALATLGPDLPFELRICGDGSNSPELARLQAMRGVTVEKRWIPEGELAALVAWADAVVLPYREASQSGVAAAAIAQGRYVLATKVGGLPEQLADVPGAVLCDPSGPAIAAALAGLFTAPPPPPVDAAANWRAMAAAMLPHLHPARRATIIGR